MVTKDEEELGDRYRLNHSAINHFVNTQTVNKLLFTLLPMSRTSPFPKFFQKVIANSQKIIHQMENEYRKFGDSGEKPNKNINLKIKINHNKTCRGFSNFIKRKSKLNNK